LRADAGAAMKSKSRQIREALALGDQIGALHIVARFFDRSSATRSFKRGLDAYNHPDFYHQLGQQRDEITASAVTALVERFGGARL
jgi:hypothetical protein